MASFQLSIVVLAMAGILQGCTTTNIKNPLGELRQHRMNHDAQKLRNEIAIKRSQTIQSNETHFAKAIQCLSDNWLQWQVAEAEDYSRKELVDFARILIEDPDYKKYPKAVIVQGKPLLDDKDVEIYQLDLQKLGDAIRVALKEKNDKRRKLNDKERALNDEKILLDERKQVLNDKKSSLEKSNKKLDTKKQKELEEIPERLSKNNNKLSKNAKELSEITERITALEKYRERVLRIYKYTDDYKDGSKLRKISVAPIYDKTEKIFPSTSTALSEIVAHALSHNTAINVIDTPYNVEDSSISRVIVHQSQGQSIGKSIPANMFVSGALVQYDEGDAKPYLDYLDVSLNTVSLSKDIKSITVGLVLRLVQTADGAINHSKFLDRTEISDFYQNPPNSIFLENTFFVQNVNGGVLRIIGSKHWGINGSIGVSDPKTYAVREMVDYAIYELLKKALPNHFIRQYDKAILKMEYKQNLNVCDSYLKNSTQ